MKSEVEIRRKLKSIRCAKSIAKRKGQEQNYILQCKLIKFFKWILDEEDIKVKDKRIRLGDYKK